MAGSSGTQCINMRAQVVLISSSVAKVVVGYSSQVVRERFFKFVVIVLVFCITTHFA